MIQKKDLRIVKTQNSLYNALLNIMKDKAFEEIKVSDICTKALVNRSTFYSHYNDKYELLLDFINNLKSNLLKALSENKGIVNTKEFYLEMIKLVLNHIDEQKEIYYSILLSNRNSIITDIIIDVTVKDINKRIEIDNINKGTVPTDILVKFYLGAVCSVGVEWLKSQGKYTKQDVINYLNQLIPDEITK